MKFYLNCGMVIALLFTVSLVRVSLAWLRRGKRSTQRLAVRSSAPSPAKDPRSAAASAQPQIIARGDQVEVLTAAGVISAHTAS